MRNQSETKKTRKNSKIKKNRIYNRPLENITNKQVLILILYIKNQLQEGIVSGQLLNGLMALF